MTTSPSSPAPAPSAASLSPPRTSYLGGSDAAAVLGCSPWRSRYRLWCEKTGTEPPPSLDSVEWVYWGNVLEPIVADEFARRLGKKLRVQRQVSYHKRLKFLAGHIDRLVMNEPAFLECKTTNAFDYRDWGESESGVAGVPDHYVAQCDHYMMVRDCEYCYVAVLIGGNDFRWYKIDRDTQREQRLFTAEVDFWELVQKNQPPEITSEEDSRHRWQSIMAGTSVEVDATTRGKIVQLAAVTERRKEAAEEEKKLRDQLFPLFADKQFLSQHGEPLMRLTLYPRKSLDLDKLREKHPKIVARFEETKHSKRLKILI